ncbi:tRNA preQ1(34) S-adenosylmethionine ribosyltransferase-isomerase QueA [Candidatus Latescibacterota bacterium]
MKLDDYDYDLPKDLIAQEPAKDRDHSRLLVLDVQNNAIQHAVFRELPAYLRAGDVVVINDTRVFPARLIGSKADTGGEIEVFLLTRHPDGSWDALTRPARRVSSGTQVIFGDGLLEGTVVEKKPGGQVIITLTSAIPIEEAIDRVGETPLPPYIRRAPTPEDRTRYQTVYARKRGAVAAPTAGLHFTDALLKEIEERGAKKTSVTLHVGIGTFRPLRPDDIDRETLHPEYCVVDEAAVETIQSCRKGDGRVFAVGTTTVRALESASQNGSLEPFEGSTDLFIKPPYRFRSVDALVTNFHLPLSSLFILVCAFAGRERVLDAYREAVRERYRFYSYGDAMLILGVAP